MAGPKTSWALLQTWFCAQLEVPNEDVQVAFEQANIKSRWLLRSSCSLFVICHKRRREKSCMKELDQFVQSVKYSSMIANSQKKYMRMHISKYGRHTPCFYLVSMLGGWLWVRTLDQSLSHGRVRADFCTKSRGTCLHSAARQSRHRLFGGICSTQGSCRQKVSPATADCCAPASQFGSVWSKATPRPCSLHSL